MTDEQYSELLTYLTRRFIELEQKLEMMEEKIDTAIEKLGRIQ